jgi:predicted transcriptional regulator of viral defense system
MRSGITEKNRAFVDRLHQSQTGPFGIEEAAKLLGISLPRARRLLSWLENRGWLARVRRGLYITVPLGTRTPAEWREDPWVVATKVFAPCYVGGWSACEHWGLTEQIFRAIAVYTTKALRVRAETIQTTPFVLRHTAPRNLFGLRPVWRERVKTHVSDPTRTIVDCLDEPAMGGGVAHVAHALEEYFAGEHRNESLLIDYGRRLDNGAIFKRLGYLIETMGLDAPATLAACLERRTAGLVRLDPSVTVPGRIVRRWNLRANISASALGSKP